MPKKRAMGDIPPLLEDLTATDLRFLCSLFRLRRGRSKANLIEELLGSSYSREDVLRKAAEIRFSGRIAELIPKAGVQEILSANGLPTAGSRKLLVLRLVENDLFDAKALIDLISNAAVKDFYHAIFGRVPTMTREHAVDEIIASAQLASHTAVQEPVRPPEEYEYDVAISFAGEDRGVAKEIAERLIRSGIRVFFDQFYQAQLWGKDLAVEFQARYGQKTRFVMPLISKHYVIKDWTDYEFRIAKQEALARGHEFILPVRLDDTPLVGLRSTIAYLALTREGVDGVVVKILEKLDRKPDTTAVTPPSPSAKGIETAPPNDQPRDGRTEWVYGASGIRHALPQSFVVGPVVGRHTFVNKVPLGRTKRGYSICLRGELSTDSKGAIVLPKRRFAYKLSRLSSYMQELVREEDHRRGWEFRGPVEVVAITEAAMSGLRGLGIPFFKPQEE